MPFASFYHICLFVIATSLTADQFVMGYPVMVYPEVYDNYRTSYETQNLAPPLPDGPVVLTLPDLSLRYPSTPLTPPVRKPITPSSWDWFVNGTMETWTRLVNGTIVQNLFGSPVSTTTERPLPGAELIQNFFNEFRNRVEVSLPKDRNITLEDLMKAPIMSVDELERVVRGLLKVTKKSLEVIKQTTTDAPEEIRKTISDVSTKTTVQHSDFFIDDEEFNRRPKHGSVLPYQKLKPSLLEWILGVDPNDSTREPTQIEKFLGLGPRPPISRGLYKSDTVPGFFYELIRKKVPFFEYFFPSDIDDRASRPRLLDWNWNPLNWLK